MIFVAQEELIKTIHLNTSEKLDKLRKVTEFQGENLTEYQSLKTITNAIMWKAEKSDSNFLLWLHYMGHYIKYKYKGYWVLLRRERIFSEGTFLSPAIMDKTSDIWTVGDFCHTLYYKKGRMRGISFDTIYKIHIERLAWKPKFEDLNIPREDLIMLE
ncbi:hypothetical protein [Allomuricauda sp. SCSIO 65647]|uniref:hypothetical protein n=1 Tax=Allomuricauda sp. SCSIO 65647 TaxID=2908843 RepID=UPI001F24F0A2|nr:hypothetical protein [Muricauda sp. SCSIO 65647]UJH68997.1 hypothetical protein L0P89_07220 [Muricauda sp. SCSIO 65647]